MQQTEKFFYTDPKISPDDPKPCNMSDDWYVWFRFFNSETGRMQQLRFKKGINKIKNYKERLKEANGLRTAIKQELQDGWNPFERPEPGTINIYTIKAAIEFVLKLKEKTLRKKTKYAYTYITNIFVEWLQRNGYADRNIKFFSTRQAQEYMDWLLLNKNYSGRTFNDHLIVLRTFFNCFIAREWCDKNPFRAIKKMKQTVGRNLAFTDSEKNMLSNYLYEHDRRMYYFTQFIYHCFIRRTELTYIKIKHIDLANETIIIPAEAAKNSIQESVVIPTDLVPVLKEMELHRYPSEYYLFGRELLTSTVQYKNPNWISTRHNDVVKSLGISPEKGLYSWKHTGAVAYYYLTKKDIYSVMRQLRHRELNTTMIYLKSLGLIKNDVFRDATAA